MQLKNIVLITLLAVFSAPVAAYCDGYYDNEEATVFSKIKTGTVQVGVDNDNQPIYLGYKTQGKNDGRPVLVFSDIYLGIQSWQHVQAKFSKDYFTIAYDSLGFGTSSKNSPTALDGINNMTGYSYRQEAYFLHQLLNELNPIGAITYVPVDTRGQIGMWYTVDYANSSHPFTKLFFETVNPSPSVAYDNDPCTLAFVPYSAMQQIVAYYGVDPQAATTLILGSTFKTAECPSVEQDLLALAVPYMSSAPADVFARIALDTLREDLMPLMSDPAFANVPVSNIYPTEADSAPSSRRAILSSFVGNAPGYPNPSFQGACVTPLPTYFGGFPISYNLTYPGHGNVVHLTAYGQFVHDLYNFVSGNLSRCSVRLPN